MSKKDRKAKKADELKDACLHCAFFAIHGDKWPDWRNDVENSQPDAFNDLVRSAVKIVAEIFTMMHPLDQMKFQSRVMESYQHMTGGNQHPQSVADVIELFKAQVEKENGPTKH